MKSLYKVLKNTLLVSIILIFNQILGQKKQEGPKTSTANPSKTEIKTDTIKLKQESLTDIVKSKADNIRNDIPKEITYLNKQAQVIYGDMQIDADYISIDRKASKVFARGKTDSLGKIISPAKALQGGKSYEYDSFVYNLKTKQAVAYNTRTQEGEGMIAAEKTKKVNDSVFFMRNSKYTTDEYFIKRKDTLADYYMLANNIKLVKKKESSQLITGPIQMYISDVPTPFALPFAVLPMSTKRAAGLLMPSFGERQDAGFFMQNLGYYQPLGDHFDLKIMSDFFTRGSWNFKPELNYFKNYSYRGSFRTEIGKTISGIKGLDNYSESKTYLIAWSHSQDAKSNPFLQFSASVNITSSKFYNNTLNNRYVFNQNVLNAQQNSSINLTKNFLELPINLTANASFSQNFATNLVDLNLPSLQLNINPFYLIPVKSGLRQGLLENIRVNTSVSMRNYYRGLQDDLFTSAMWKGMQSGLQNQVALSTNAQVFKYFTFSLSANINNIGTNKIKQQEYDPLQNKVVTQDINKLSLYSTFSTSASLQTVLYGMMKFGKESKVQAIRHMLTPSLSFSYSPDFSTDNWGYYRTYYNARGEKATYSIYEGGIYGAPGRGLSQSLGFSLSNNLEMKVKSDEEATGVKKIKIFENLGISTGYNFAAEKFKMANISVNTQTNFLEGKISVNSSMQIDPYKTAINPQNLQFERIDQLGDFRVTNFNVQASVPINRLFESKENKSNNAPNNINPNNPNNPNQPINPATTTADSDKKDLSKKYKERGEIMLEKYYFDEDHYAQFGQTWTLNANTQFNYSNNLNGKGNKTASLGLDGSLQLTPHWALNGSAFYDVVNGQISYSRIGFARNLRSFSFTLNWVPTGQYKVYDFFISIKASILRDAVKYNTRSFQRNSSF